MVNDIEIAIIGAGVSGLSCAIKLANLSRDVIVFERQTESGGAPLHCGHKGFGIVEFQKILTGKEYAKVLTKKAKKVGVKIELRHSLFKIDDNVLYFATQNGLKRYRAKRVVFAMGVRESHRSNYLISGSRSPNVITTGALQRLIYEEGLVPFDKGVIYNTELVSFSALATSKKHDIDIVSMIEKDENIKSFPLLKPIAKNYFKTDIKTDIKEIKIEAEDKKITHIAIKKRDNFVALRSDGIIFSGGFRPESAILQERFEEFNYTNRSVQIDQNFRLKDGRFFAVGNVTRGALAAFKCYLEGKNCALEVDRSLKNKRDREIVEIKLQSDKVEWYTPSLIDLNSERKYLTKLRFKKHERGFLRVYLNDKLFITQRVDAKPYITITIPWINYEVKKDDKIEITFTTAHQDI